jgi:hypothetical protein
LRIDRLDVAVVASLPRRYGVADPSSDENLQNSSEKTDLLATRLVNEHLAFLQLSGVSAATKTYYSGHKITESLGNVTV